MKMVRCRGIGMAVCCVLINALGFSSIWAQAPNKDSLLAPISLGGNDGLNAIFLVPALDSAITQGKKSFKIELISEYVKNDFNHTSGNSRFAMDGGAFEFRAKATVGVADFLDLSLTIPYLAFDSGVTGIIGGQSLFPDAQGGGRIEVDNEISDPVLGAKFQLWGGKESGTGLSLRTQFKIPMADERDLHSSGGLDVAAGLLFSSEVPFGVFHLNVDYVFYGDDDIFRPQANVDLANSISAGGSYMFELIEDKLALGGQLFAYANPLRDSNGNLDGLNGPPVGLTICTRWFPRKNVGVEFSAGPGLTKDAGALYAVLGLSFHL